MSLRAFRFFPIAVLPAVCSLLLSASARGQIKLPGGITIPAPSQRTAPNQRQIPGRPNPDTVCPPLLQWQHQFTAEYPSLDVPHTMVSKLEQMSLPLFADPAFTPYFHKSYTALTPDELDAIHRNAIACQTSNYRSQFQLLSTLMSAFETRVNSHTLSPGRLTQQLQTLNQARTQIADAETQISTLPATASSADSLRSTKAKVTPNLQLLWPSERDNFNRAVTEAEARLVLPVFAAKADPVLSAPASTETLLALHRLRSQVNTLPPPARDEWQLKIDSRYDAILPAVLADQKKDMLAFRATPEGLQQGAAWLNRFQSTYVSQLQAPGASDLAKQYLAIREKQLAQQEPELRHRIETASSLDGTAEMIDAAFPLPSDKSTASYSRLQQAQGARKEFFEKQERAAQEARDQAEARREAQLHGNAPATQVHTASQGRGNAAARPAPPTSENATMTDFSAHGLANEQAILSVYRGDFDKVQFERDDLQFEAMISGYMGSYWDQCQDFLTRDRTPIMKQECRADWVNGYGVHTGCARWETIPTGKFADRPLYNAANALQGQLTKKYLANTLTSVTNATSLTDIFSGAVGQAGDINTMQNDVASTIQRNGCTSPALMRFQENLKQFALGRQGIRLDGTKVHFIATEAAPPGAAFKDSNYGRLLEDLISRQARSWLVNRYIPGSVSEVQVAARDAGGRPEKVDAGYAFSGLGGRNTGKVVMSFSDGLPECLYFSDLPNNCLTPDRQIVTAYGNGAYPDK